MGKIRYVISALIMALLVGVCCAVPTSAATEYKSGYYTYTVFNGRATIVDCDSSVMGSITIPSELGGYPVTSIGDYAFSMEGIPGVTLPDIFEDANDREPSSSYPTDVSLDRNYKSGVCTQLVSVVIPETVTDIGYGAFEACENLEEVSLPYSIKNIGSTAFYCCSSLKKIYYSGSQADIERICIGGSNDELFEAEWVLNVCGGSNTHVYEYPCAPQCSVCDYVRIENHTYAADCVEVCSICNEPRVAPAEHNFVSVCDTICGGCGLTRTANAGHLFDNACDTSCNLCGEFRTVPDHKYADEGDTTCDVCGNIRGIDYEFTVENKKATITAYKGFASELTLPATLNGYPVVSIGSSAFRNYSDLTSITIPGNITSIGDSAFYNCDGLTSIVIPTDVTSLGHGVFDYCDNLSDITIPDSVTSIGGNFAYEQHGFSGTAYYNNPKNWENGALYIGNHLIAYDGSGSYTVKSGTKTIASYAFATSEIKSVVIPNSVTNMGSHAFAWCDKLADVTLSGSIETISDHAFLFCDSLTNINIPQGVKYIGESAFEDCALTSITIPESISIIYSGAFNNNDGITDVYFLGNQTAKGKITFGGDNNGIKNAAWRYAKCINANGHVYDNNCDTTCSSCENVREITHNYKWIVDTPAGCASYGLKHEECLTCGVKSGAKEQIKPTGNHTFSWTIDKAAGCGTPGLRHEYCTNCTATRNMNTRIEPTGKHTTTTTNKKTATCTSEGYSGDTYCTSCKTTVKYGTKIAIQSHKNAWTETKATLTANGQKVYKCSVCGKVSSSSVIYRPGSFALSTEVYQYDGKVKSPSVTVKDVNGKTLVKDKDYTVSYIGDRTSEGKYTVTVKLIGEYSGTKKLYFNIIKNLAAPGKVTAELYGYDDIEITWSSVTGADAYRVYYKKSADKKYTDKGIVLTTSMSFGNLADSTEYQFMVQPCVYFNGEYIIDENSKTISFSTTKDIAAPSKVTATLYGYDDVNVTWSKVSGAAAYRVYYRKSSEKGYTYKGTTKTTSMKIADLADSTQYLFMVRPCTRVNDAYFTDNSYKTTSLTTTMNLSAPGSVTASLYGYDDVKVSWSKVFGANAYRVYYRKSTETEYTYKGITKTSSMKLPNLADGIQYLIMVRPCTNVNGGYFTGDSYKTTTVKTAKNLSAPSKVTASLYGSDDVKVTWSKVSGADAYRVYYRKSTDKDYTYKGITKTTSMKLANLADGVKYMFMVRPCTYVNGEYYTDDSYKTTYTTTLKKVSTPKVSKKNNGKVTVSWSNIAGESGYQISKSTSKTKTGTITTYTTTTGKSKDISATKGKTYYYKVRAFKTVDGKKIYGAWSSVKSYKIS